MLIRFGALVLSTLILSHLGAATNCQAALPEIVSQKSAAEQFFETIYQDWFHLHSAAAHKGEMIRADLVFAPKQGVVMLKRGGAKPTQTVQLPQGMSWRAFQISVHGVRELSFPVVIQRPHHHEPRSHQDDEEILIIGDARQTRMCFQIASRLTGVDGSGSGGGLGISKRNNFTVSMPAIQDSRFQSQVSMLPLTALDNQPFDAVEFDDVRVEVIRKRLQ